MSATLPDWPTLLRLYVEGAAELRQAVEGLTAEQARARPIPGKWSTLEVVCHLADFEPMYADRIKRVLALDRPPLFSADENRFAAALNYHGRDLAEEVELIFLTRNSLARLLQGVPLEAMQRVGVFHADDGTTRERSILDLLAGVTRHIPHHLSFIREKRRALGVG